MSNLSNLYISQSYFGLVNIGDSTKPFSSQSGEIEFQDGIGESLGLTINTQKDYTFKKNVNISESLEVIGDLSGSNARFTGDLFVSGTVHAYEVITLIESASVIFTTGSNIIGDDVSDTQTIVGQTSISGSLTVIGPHSHTGNVNITGSLFVSNDISSSTINGLGNAQQFSQSVDSRLDYLEGPFSTSVDSRLDLVEATASYLNTTFSTSVDSRLDNIESYTSSLKTAFSVNGTDVNFNNDINVTGTIRAYEIHTIIESSSVIYSSGSNILGDEVSDTQILSGSVYIPNLEYLAGNPLDTNLRINQKLNTASYDNFINNVYTPFSTSVDGRLDALENFSSSLVQDFVEETDFRIYTASIDNKFVAVAQFSGSVNQTTASLNLFTSSQESKNSTLATYTGSNDAKWNTLGLYTGSIDNKFVEIANSTGSLNAFTASQNYINSTYSQFTSSIQSYTASNDSKVNQLISVTGSYATTGSNTFVGDQTYSSSLFISGGVEGKVYEIAVASSTASIDCSKGNFFVLNLSSSGSVLLKSTNVTGGRTITLKVNKINSGATVAIDTSTIKMPLGFSYIVSDGSNITDIMTFVSFGTGSLFGVSAYNFS